MTGFDETAPSATPPDDDDLERPEHDSTFPALDDDAEPDEPGGSGPEPMAGDPDLQAGQIGPDPTR